MEPGNDRRVAETDPEPWYRGAAWCHPWPGLHPLRAFSLQPAAVCPELPGAGGDHNADHQYRPFLHGTLAWSCGSLVYRSFPGSHQRARRVAFLFLAISTGLGLGAGQALVTIVALAVILGLIIVRGLFREGPNQANLYLTVSSPSASKLGAERILQVLSGVGATAALKRFDQTPESLEAAFLVDFKQVAHLEQFTNQLRELSPEVKVSCVDDRGMIG